ncbi:MAG: amino acid ABC transporter substrate-binding protein [Alphaproteobacteria bacterium]|nr:amino acid ABC transporter substrate-binding protein [Alphaproteobacteria bacterium]
MKRRHLLPALTLLVGGVVGGGGARAAPVLRVGAALPDPPFEFMTAAGPAGFDIMLMQRIAALLGREWQLVPYTGADFNGIFAGLNNDTCDCIASGTTTTPARERIADFCAPYVVSGQSLVVDPRRHPTVHGIDDLKGLVIGVQQGNTSQPVADRLVAEHRAARVRVYAYDQIETALDDLVGGGCDVFMKLAPVTEWYVRSRPWLQVVQTGITRERLGICVRKGNVALRDAIGAAQAALEKDGTLPALIAQWLAPHAAGSR